MLKISIDVFKKSLLYSLFLKLSSRNIVPFIISQCTVSTGVRLSLVITGLFVGFIMVTHVNSIPAESYSSDNSNEKKYVLETLIEEQAQLKSRIVGLRNTIEEQEQNLKLYGQTKNVETLDTIKKRLGLTTQAGSGIEIYFNDSTSVNRETVDVNNEALVHAADIRDIVNILRISQAAAISINDQRILASSPVSCVGNSILINNTHTAPPFKIKAIVDYEIAKNNILNESYLADVRKRIEKYGLEFEVQKKDHITVPLFNGDLKAKYIQ